MLAINRLLVVFALGSLACAQTASSTLPQNASLTPTAQVGVSPSPSPSPNVIANPNSDTRDLLPGLAEIPNGKVSLIGGTIRDLDRVRDRIVIQVFGGSKAVVLFDPRTHVYRDGTAASTHDLAPGERIYVDTLLDGTDVFAKNIRIVRQGSVGQSGGQIVEHEPGSSELTVRDVLSPEPLKVHLDRTSTVMQGGRQVSADALVPGALVSMDFRPNGRGEGIVRQISILALPGSSFSFNGRVAHLDMSRGLIVILDPRDQRSYEVHCDPSLLRSHPDLHEGTDVAVNTSFDGSQYTAKSLAIVPPNANK